MPYPKRVSCANCVKAKRRCNLGQPRCHRCTEKDIPCVYEVDPTANVQVITSSAARSAEKEPTVETSSSLWPSATTLQGFTAASNGDSAFAMDLTPISNFDTSIDWFGNIMTSPSLDVDEFVDCSSLAKQIEEDTTVMTGEIYMPRVHYVVSRIKTWTAMFTQRSTTPFIHRSLFSGVEGSADMTLDALSACALYAAKNKENSRAVFEYVRRKARRLTTERGERKWKEPGELLASLQSLLLYQIIRLFDGDIRLRAEAEIDATVQVRWTVELLKYFRPLKSLDMATDQLMPYGGELGLTETPNWRNWVFDESVRRTILTSYMIQGVYSFLKDGWDPVCGKVEKLSLTAQKELWDAPSEFHWDGVWTKKPSYEIRISQWENDAADITVDDVDELGLIMKATLKDLDLTAQWVGKENLVRYCLDWESMNKYMR